MKNYIFTDNNGLKYRRVSRQMAKKLYNAGVTVTFCPSNLKPFTMFGFSADYNRNNYRDKNTDKNGGLIDNFDDLTMYFTHYNCTTNETGRYIAFYVPTN